MARPRLSFFPSDYAKFPPQVDADGNEGESSRGIKIVLDVTGGGATDEIDLGDLLGVQVLTNVQSIKIDNSGGANPVTVASVVVGDSIGVPSGYQYQGPFEFTINDNKLRVTRSDAGTLTVFLFNTPRPLACWPATAAAAAQVVIAPSSTATPANVAMTGASVQMFAANANRKVATIYNDGAATMYVQFGAAASSTSFIVALQPQSYYEMPQPIYIGAVNALAASGTARVMEQS